jgi:hypothetical protein
VPARPMRPVRPALQQQQQQPATSVEKHWRQHQQAQHVNHCAGCMHVSQHQQPCTASLAGNTHIMYKHPEQAPPAHHSKCLSGS